jgi:hypothetical protein
METLAPILARIAAAKDARRELRALVRNALGDDDDEEPAGDDSSDDEDDDDSDDERAADRTDDARLAPFKGAKLFPNCEGTALFAVICCMNHSCVPNVQVRKVLPPYVIMPTTRILSLQVCYAAGDHAGAVVAQRPIAAGEELCINYVNVARGTGVLGRAADLAHYGFDCDCPRCVEERTVGNAA